MTDKPPRDMAASVRARLMKYAKEHGEAFDLVLIRFALERLLYRLSQSAYRDRFVVKQGGKVQVEKCMALCETLLNHLQKAVASFHEM